MNEHEDVETLLDRAENENRCAAASASAGKPLYHALRRRVRTGELISPYPGVYMREDYWRNLDPEQRSLHLIRALAVLHPRWVFAGVSAACLYGVEHSFSLHADNVVYIASRGGRSIHDAPLLRRVSMRHIPARQRNGVPVTSPERTLIDCARLPFHLALGIFDSAFRRNLVSTASLTRFAGKVKCDKDALAHLLRHVNPRSENGGESMMRALIIEQGFVTPELQVEFANPDNPQFPYRADFCWKPSNNRIIVAEYDGMAKYADTSNRNRSTLQAKLEYERIRERVLRDNGVTTILHIVYEDLTNPTRLAMKLAEAGVPRTR